MEVLLSIKPQVPFSFLNCPKWHARQSMQIPSPGLLGHYSLTRRVVGTHSMDPRKSIVICTNNHLHTAGATLACILLEGNLLLQNAYAEDSALNEPLQAVSRQPQWLVPAVLSFPVISYAIFTIYRDKVNPSAKVSDWMLGLAAMVIVANIVTIVTLGVRLY